MSWRVVICDDIPIIRNGLSSMLAAELDIEIVGAADSDIQAMILIRRSHPHVIVTGLSGLELINRVSQECLEPTPRVIVLSMNENDDVISDVLRAGASGVLMKTASREELSLAVRSVALGHTALAPQIATRLVGWFLASGAIAEDLLRPQMSAITAREQQVLTLVARGMSTEEVATELSIGVTTVRTHIYRLCCKLSLKDRAQLVSFAYRAGLMQPA